MIAGDNGRLTYSIAGGNDKEHFQISPNGTIITSKSLDRESKLHSFHFIVDLFSLLNNY